MQLITKFILGEVLTKISVPYLSIMKLNEWFTKTTMVLTSPYSTYIWLVTHLLIYMLTNNLFRYTVVRTGEILAITAGILPTTMVRPSPRTV